MRLLLSEHSNCQSNLLGVAKKPGRLGGRLGKAVSKRQQICLHSKVRALLELERADRMGM